jgi:amidase
LRLSALEDLLLGDDEADEYRRMLGIVEVAVGEAADAPALAQPIDDLYWTFRRLQAYEAWATHGAWISAADRGLGPGVKERFEFGATIDAATAAAETGRRDAFRSELAQLLGSDGLLVLPTVPGAAPSRDGSFDELQAYRERALRLLCLSGLSGFPQITLPLGRVDDAPFGISLIGPAGADMALIRLGSRILNSTGRR